MCTSQSQPPAEMEAQGMKVSLSVCLGRKGLFFSSPNQKVLWKVLGHPLIPTVMVEQYLCNGLTASTMQAEAMAQTLCTVDFLQTMY